MFAVSSKMSYSLYTSKVLLVYRAIMGKMAVQFTIKNSQSYHRFLLSKLGLVMRLQCLYLVLAVPQGLNLIYK